MQKLLERLSSLQILSPGFCRTSRTSRADPGGSVHGPSPPGLLGEREILGHLEIATASRPSSSGSIAFDPLSLKEVPETLPEVLASPRTASGRTADRGRWPNPFDDYDAV